MAGEQLTIDLEFKASGNADQKLAEYVKLSERLDKLLADRIVKEKQINDLIAKRGGPGGSGGSGGGVGGSGGGGGGTGSGGGGPRGGGLSLDEIEKRRAYQERKRRAQWELKQQQREEKERLALEEREKKAAYRERKKAAQFELREQQKEEKRKEAEKKKIENEKIAREKRIADQRSQNKTAIFHNLMSGNVAGGMIGMAANAINPMMVNPALAAVMAATAGLRNLAETARDLSNPHMGGSAASDRLLQRIPIVAEMAQMFDALSGKAESKRKLYDETHPIRTERMGMEVERDSRIARHQMDIAYNSAVSKSYGQPGFAGPSLVTARGTADQQLIYEEQRQALPLLNQLTKARREEAGSIAKQQQAQKRYLELEKEETEIKEKMARLRPRALGKRAGLSDAEIERQNKMLENLPRVPKSVFHPGSTGGAQQRDAASQLEVEAERLGKINREKLSQADVIKSAQDERNARASQLRELETQKANLDYQQAMAREQKAKSFAKNWGSMNQMERQFSIESLKMGIANDGFENLPRETQEYARRAAPEFVDKMLMKGGQGPQLDELRSLGKQYGFESEVADYKKLEKVTDEAAAKAQTMTDENLKIAVDNAAKSTVDAVNRLGEAFAKALLDVEQRIINKLPLQYQRS